MDLKARGKSHIGSASCWGSDVQITDEYMKRVWKYWHQKNKDTRFKLTPSEILGLLDEAGITIDLILAEKRVKPFQVQLEDPGDIPEILIARWKQSN